MADAEEFTLIRCRGICNLMSLNAQLCFSFGIWSLKIIVLHSQFAFQPSGSHLQTLADTAERMLPW